MVSKGFPNVTTSGRQYNFGEKPSVILYTYINLHAGTPKPQSFLSKSPGLQCSIVVGRPGSSEVPRNPLTRWDLSSIPANGIFLTKKLKNKNKNAQQVEND